MLFQNYLFRLRRIRGYSQKQLALLVGLRIRKPVSDFEMGRRLPPLRVAMAFEVVLGAKLSEIYPDLYHDVGLQAVAREDQLPTRFRRQIRGRFLGQDPLSPHDHLTPSRTLSTKNAQPDRGVQRRLPF